MMVTWIKDKVWDFKHERGGPRQRFDWWVAWLLPRNIALNAYVRVVAVTMEPPSEEYERTYKAWEAAS